MLSGHITRPSYALIYATMPFEAMLYVHRGVTKFSRQHTLPYCWPQWWSTRASPTIGCRCVGGCGQCRSPGCL